MIDALNALTMDDIPLDFMWKAQPPEVFFLCMEVFYNDIELMNDSGSLHLQVKGGTCAEQRELKQEQNIGGIKCKVNCLDEKRDEMVINSGKAALTQAKAFE